MHQEYLKAFADKAASDVRVLGTWLEGSFAKGTADRYSDIDIHLWDVRSTLQDLWAPHLL